MIIVTVILVALDTLRVENTESMELASNPKQSPRIAELDALRGLAALAVTVYALTTHFDDVFVRSRPLLFGFPYGEQGVPLFFMISGFVIFMTLERTKSVGDFALGRFSRLFPAFWASMLITYSVVSTFGLPGSEVTIRELGLNATMMPRLLHARPVDWAYWSLEFELWFYAAMVVLYSLGAFQRIVKVLQAWLVLAIISNAVLLYGDADSMLYRLMGKLKTLTSLEYIHLFAIGMIFYDVRRAGAWTRGHGVALACCVGIIFWTSTPVVGVVVCLLACLLYAAATSRLPFLNAKLLGWFGYISYPLYLIHQNIGFVILRWLDRLGWEPHLALVATSAVVIGLAAAITYAVERPGMRFIRDLKLRRGLVSSTPALSNS